MSDTPPKTDPALERLAREMIEQRDAYLEAPHPDVSLRLILETFAPLVDVVEGARKLRNEVRGVTGYKEDEFRILVGNSNMAALNHAECELSDALDNLDAGGRNE